MDCCQCEGIESKFDQKNAAKELEQYRNVGLSKNTRMLIDAIKAEGISEMTLLDIGGGVGLIQHELLKAGVSSCFNVEASRAYVEVTKQEANRQGHGNKINHIHGNFVDLAMDIPQCDIVTLDRVICCYHDVWELVGKSCAKATRLYAIVYPLDTLRSKFYSALENLYYRIKRSSFRTYIHPTETVEEIVHNNGFERRFYREAGTWQIIIYERTGQDRDPI
ncbi:MAG: class I SAM-dependent methyltransferase [Candidatus Thorarchaeota archaeon]|jgi:magnesium-protoporphyrin O-methyltransferase